MVDDAQLVEQFVTELNRRGLEPLCDDGIPNELLTNVTEFGEAEWEIRAADDNSWVPQIEQKLPFQFPSLFRYFITHFRFAEFEVAGVSFFGNTGADLWNELSSTIFKDKVLFPFLLEREFIQFGRQEGGGYDPVCFDMNRREGGDAPIVQIDHEAVLIDNRLHVIREISPSFRVLIERFIGAKT